MQLKPPDSPELKLIAGWLASKENYQWLEFGDGRQLASPEWLKIAMQRGIQVLRVFTSDVDDVPIGVVGLSGVNRCFKTASLWVVLGEKAHSGRGYATRAMSGMATVGFAALGLGAIHTWVVEHNLVSLRAVQRVGFKPMGRQRRCHYIDGQPYDRLWFDLLASEHEEIRDGRRQQTA